MGYLKDLHERLGGGNPAACIGVHVCAACFLDQALKAFIEGAASADTCDFCDAESDEPIAAPLVQLLEHINDSLASEYGAAENSLPYESAEGGYQGLTWTTEEVLESELGPLPNDDDGRLLRTLCDGLGDRSWCRRHPHSLSRDERLRFSWDEFCDLVKHRRHYFFLAEERKDDELFTPLALLEELARWCGEFGLVRTLPSGSVFYRARYQEPGETLSTAADLGPPPEAKAVISNRMSPPGIVMSYVSEDGETAVREIARVPGSFAVGGFRTRRDIRILDLAGVPAVPSIFADIADSLEYDPRPLLIFLNYFASDLSKPIARDDRVHVEYIPTQIVTEYFRTEFLYEGARIDGIRYRSARYEDHSSLVLFAAQDDFVGGIRSVSGFSINTPDPWIELICREQRDVTTNDLIRWDVEAPQEVDWL